MEGPGPGGGGKGGQVLGGHTGPHKDLQLRPGGLYQPLQQSCSLRGAGSLAAGKDGGKAQSPGSLQCGKGVPADVKGTVQGAGNGAACSCCRPAGTPARSLPIIL